MFLAWRGSGGPGELQLILSTFDIHGREPRVTRSAWLLMHTPDNNDKFNCESLGVVRHPPGGGPFMSIIVVDIDNGRNILLML